MQLSVYNNVANSYNYEMKSIRYHISLKEFIFLLTNEILPNILSKFQLRSSSGLGLTVFGIYFHKPRLTYLIRMYSKHFFFLLWRYLFSWVCKIFTFFFNFFEDRLLIFRISSSLCILIDVYF